MDAEQRPVLLAQPVASHAVSAGHMLKAVLHLKGVTGQHRVERISYRSPIRVANPYHPHLLHPEELRVITNLKILPNPYAQKRLALSHWPKPFTPERWVDL